MSAAGEILEAESKLHKLRLDMFVSLSRQRRIFSWQEGLDVGVRSSVRSRCVCVCVSIRSPWLFVPSQLAVSA